MTLALAPAVSSSVDDAVGQCRPHDLLRLKRLDRIDGEPAWLREAFERAPFAVVRRAAAPAGFVAIGLRGVGRSQRFGCFAARDEIESRIAPEELFAAYADAARESRDLPAFDALLSLMQDAPRLNGFVWGPTGSTGFELATSVHTVTASSDLDLLIRAPQRFSRDDALLLLRELERHAISFGIRIDPQIETPSGGIALAEWAQGNPRMLVRDARPRFVDDPWNT